MLFVGDDWADDHHDVYLMNDTGVRLASRRLPEGLAGIGRLHELIAEHAEDPCRARPIVVAHCSWPVRTGYR
jgi:hypothetical protein